MRFLLILAILCTSAQAAEVPRYNAHDTLVKAQVGTNSVRVTSPVRTRMKLKRAPATFERMVCRENPAEPRTIICTQKRTTHGY